MEAIEITEQNLLDTFLAPIEKVKEIISGTQEDEIVLQLIERTNEIYYDKNNNRYNKLQFMGLQKMFDGLEQTLEIPIVANFRKDVLTVFQQYFHEKFSDDLAIMNEERTEFLNKELILEFHNLCLGVLNGQIALEQAVKSLVSSKAPFNSSDFPNDMLDSYNFNCDEKIKACRILLAVNLVATFNAAQAVKQYMVHAKQEGLSRIFELAYGGHRQRQEGNIWMLENPNERASKQAWFQGGKSILTNSTFGSVVLFMLFSNTSENNNQIALEEKLRQEVFNNKQLINITTFLIQRCATPLIRAYNNGGQIFDNFKRSKKEIERLFKENPGKHIFEILRDLDISQNPLLNRLKKDIIEREHNALLAGILTRDSSEDQLLKLLQNIRIHEKHIKIAKQGLFQYSHNLPGSMLNLILGFTFFNYQNYSKPYFDYDALLDTNTDSEAKVKFAAFARDTPISFLKFTFGRIKKMYFKET